MFGTGKFYDRADKQDSSLQSVYALWEKAGSNQRIAGDRSDTLRPLLQLSLAEVPAPPPSSGNDRVINGEENINWQVQVAGTSTSASMGWRRARGSSHLRSVTLALSRYSLSHHKRAATPVLGVGSLTSTGWVWRTI